MELFQRALRKGRLLRSTYRPWSLCIPCSLGFPGLCTQECHIDRAFVLFRSEPIWTRRSHRSWCGPINQAKCCQAWCLCGPQTFWYGYNEDPRPIIWIGTWHYLPSIFYAFEHMLASRHLDTIPWRSKCAFVFRNYHIVWQHCHDHFISRLPFLAWLSSFALSRF